MGLRRLFDSGSYFDGLGDLILLLTLVHLSCGVDLLFFALILLLSGVNFLFWLFLLLCWFFCLLWLLNWLLRRLLGLFRLLV